MKIDRIGKMARVWYQGAPKKMVNAISKRRGIPEKVVKELLYYNIVTPSQLSELTGCALSDIDYHTKTRIINKGGKKKKTSNLTRCHPFFQLFAKQRLYIYRDKKFNEFLKKKLEIDF